MSIQQNTDRIQTTHIGSLPRPHKVLDLLKAKFANQPYDPAALDAAITEGVRENVRKQPRWLRQLRHQKKSKK